MAEESTNRESRDLTDAANEMREPREAKELRARDTERMLEYLEDAEQRAAQADATLSATSRQLQANAAELERRKRELQRQRSDGKRDSGNASVADHRSPAE